MEKNLKLPMSFEKVEGNVLNDDTLIFSRVKIMHSDINLNNSNFDKPAIDDAENSLKNKPILAYIKKTDGEESKDFAGHEIEYKISDGELVTTYLERPIGLIPESNNYELVEEDGKLWVYSDAYLWADYMNDAYDIFQENNVKSVSMEIVVDEYEVTENMFDITKYRYNGVTVLGDSVDPAMSGAEIEVHFSNKNLDEEIVNRMSDLNERLSKVYEVVEEPTPKPTPDPEPVEPTVFELTYRDKYDLLAKAIKDSEGENWAWVQDFTDSYVEYEVESKPDDEWLYNRYRVSYTLVEDEVSLADDKVEIFNISVTQEEKDKIDADRRESENTISDLEMQLSTLKEEKNDIEVELNKYKSDEREAQEEALFEAFDAIFKDSVEYADIKARKDEFSIDGLETQLRVLHSKTLSPKFAKKKAHNLTTIQFNKEEKATKKNPYEGLTFNKEEK